MKIYNLFIIGFYCISRKRLLACIISFSSSRDKGGIPESREVDVLKNYQSEVYFGNVYSRVFDQSSYYYLTLCAYNQTVKNITYLYLFCPNELTEFRFSKRKYCCKEKNIVYCCMKRKYQELKSNGSISVLTIIILVLFGIFLLGAIGVGIYIIIKKPNICSGRSQLQEPPPQVGYYPPPPQGPYNGPPPLQGPYNGPPPLQGPYNGPPPPPGVLYGQPPPPGGYYAPPPGQAPYYGPPPVQGSPNQPGNSTVPLAGFAPTNSKQA